jgi:hypothetical protein
MKIDANGNVSFRQSWLNNAENCAEQGRRNLVFPELDRCSDEAFIGTAAHAGIEAVVNGECGASDIADAVAEAYRTDPEAQTIYFARPKTHQSTIGECVDLSIRCAKAWVRDIMPKAPLDGARAEVSFDVDLFNYKDRVVSIKGTCDLVPVEGALWDWKTSARSYAQKDKQKWAVQPTVYTIADALGGFGREGRQLPAEFVYGVMVKLKKECRGEIITVQRSEGHAEDLFRKIRAWVDLYNATGLTEVEWPARSEGNFLCSPVWCQHYRDCRGANISLEDDLYGYVQK